MDGEGDELCLAAEVLSEREGSLDVGEVGGLTMTSHDTFRTSQYFWEDNSR